MAYVYRHIRLDKNEPFYIGIGSDSKYKRANEKSRRNILWNRIVAKTNYEIEILFDEITFDCAKVKEIEFISLYGRIIDNSGTLSNLSTGGDGAKGVIKSKETLDKMRIAMTGRVFSENHLMKLKEANKNNRPSKDALEKARKAIKGRPAYNRKKVIDTSNNKIYSHLKDACQDLGLSYSTMKNRMCGYYINNTKLKYL